MNLSAVSGMTPKYRTFLHLLIGTVLWTLICPIILSLLVLPTFLLRCACHFCAIFLRPDLIPINGKEDSFMATAPLRPNSNNNVGQMWMLKGKLDVTKFRHHFHDLFLSTPQLRKQYRNFYCYFEVWGLYTFKKVVEEEELDLEDYIKEYKGPSFKDEGALEEFMGKWHNSRKEEGKMKTALWGMLVIYLQEKDESVLLFKIDHGLNDGFTFVNSVGVLTGNKTPYLNKGGKIGVMKKLQIILSTPSHIVSYAHSLLSTGTLPVPNYSNFHNASQNEWSIGFTTLDLDLIKQIRKVTGARINTILASIQLGALRRHCIDSNGERKLPENAYLSFPAFWPKHPAMMEDNTDGEKMGNHFTMSFLKVPFNEESSLHRLQLAEMDAAQGESVGLGELIHWLILPCLWGIPHNLFLKWMEYNDSKWGFEFLIPVNQFLGALLLSNSPYTLLGLEVKHLYLPTQGLISTPSIHMYMAPISNGGKIDVSVSASLNIFKDWDELNKFAKVYLKDELDKLANCVLDIWP